VIKELTVKEIAVCYGAVRLERHIYGTVDSIIFAWALSTATVSICYGISSKFIEPDIAAIVSTLILPVVGLAIYRNTYGTEYMVDLDANDDITAYI